MNAEDLKILEIGEFTLFKRAMPAQTTFVFTGQNRRRAEGLECRMFGPAVLARLVTALRGGAYDLVVCFPPGKPLWDPRRSTLTNLKRLLLRCARFRTLGAYVLRCPMSVPVAVVDASDASVIPAHRAALADKDRLRTMAGAGREHVLRHHTHQKLCEYILETCLEDGPLL
ncbi:MAG: hypothetical protein V1873_02225 [Verrucomicrobiota bacterium]